MDYVMRAAAPCMPCMPARRTQGEEEDAEGRTPEAKEESAEKRASEPNGVEATT